MVLNEQKLISFLQRARYQIKMEHAFTMVFKTRDSKAQYIYTIFNQIHHIRDLTTIYG